MKEFNQKI